MARTLDHIVLCVSDLEQACETYRALGFALTPPATHPFGTRNRLAQFEGRNFLELLGINDPAAIPPHRPPRQFSFAAHNQEFLRQHGEGMSMLVFAGSDARSDVAEFQSKNLSTYEPFDFGRDAMLPDGSTVKVGFSLAFVTSPAMPEIAFFTCHQRHPPELFWKSEYQQHPNGAVRLVEVVMSAVNPGSHEEFFRRLTDGPVAGGSEMLTIGPASDRITLMTPARLSGRFPEVDGIGDLEPPRFRAYRVAVRDLKAAQLCLERNGVRYRTTAMSIIVPPEAAHGIAVEFFLPLSG